MSWHALRITPSAAADEIISALFDFGAQAVEDVDGVIVTHFPPESDVTALRDQISALDPSARIETGDTPELDPSILHGSVGVQQLGRITISPPWDSADINDDGLVIIDPATAFGTGEHPTTRGVIRLMQHVIRKGDTVADLGAGSGVLGIAAAKLGASRVFAIENDQQAIGNAEENVVGNRVTGVMTVLEGEAGTLLPLVGPVNLVLANIISSVLVGLMSIMHENVVPNGHAILSGILYSERDEILESAPKSGFVFVKDDHEGEWWSVLLRRP